MRHIAAAFLFLIFACSTAALAQETTGTISGRIIDAQGLAMPGATVVITGAQGTKQAVTDEQGRFSVPFLTPGKYDIRAQLQGFKPIEQKGVTLGLGQIVELPLQMEVGSFSEAVQVTGSADILSARTTTTGANITSDMLQRVPVGRNLSSTLYLAPGVSSSGTAGQARVTTMPGAVVTGQVGETVSVTATVVHWSRPLAVKAVVTEQALAGTVRLLVKLADAPGANDATVKTGVVPVR